MQRINGVYQSKGGRVVVGAIVQVLLAGTNTPATLYADKAGTTTIAELKTDNEGEYSFYVANGRYDVFMLVNGRRDGQQLDVLAYDPDDVLQEQDPDIPGIKIRVTALEEDVVDINTDIAELRMDIGSDLDNANGTREVWGIWAKDQVLPVSDLAEPDGALMLGHGASTVGDTLTAHNASITTLTADMSAVENDLVAIAASTGSSEIGYIAAGTGTVARTAQAKLRETISVLDFGADPSFATDSTAAFQAAILAGSWNGATILIPNGTYRIAGTIYIGTDTFNQNCYSVTLVGESTHGSVLMRPKNASGGPILTVSGFHNVLEKFTLISEVNQAGTDYSASHGIYVRGNPQPGTNGNGTKYNDFRNLKIYRVGIGMQIGNYDVDGVDPDIETNSFSAIEINNCNKGVFINGQNILHNPFYACHIVDCRDYLVHQKRGGDCWFERSYFGGLYDFLTSSYNVPSTSKILIEAGVTGLIGCRSECWHESTGNATPRYSLNVTSTDSKTIILIGNTFTTRSNLNTEPGIKLSGQGSGGSASVKATLLNNHFYGYVELNTIDVFSMGNTYSGVASNNNGVVNGRLLSSNQKSQLFRDVFMDSNQTQEFNAVKFKRNSSAAITLERAAVANTSEWQGFLYADEAGLNWGRRGMAVTNATATKESALHHVSVRMNGAFLTIRSGIGTAAPNQGVWNVGDRIMNSAPAVGQPKGWINTATGGASSTTRANSTAYAVGVYAVWTTGTTVWECTTAGTSAASAPDITGKTVGQTVVDGTVTWTLRSTTQSNFVSEGNL